MPNFQFFFQRHVLSDAALTAILGGKNGINHRIKAHHVITYNQLLKKKVELTIPITCGSFKNKQQWSVLTLQPMLKWILKIPKYNCLTSPIIIIYLKHILYQPVSRQLLNGRSPSTKTSHVMITLTLMSPNSNFKGKKNEKF